MSRNGHAATARNAPRNLQISNQFWPSHRLTLSKTRDLYSRDDQIGVFSSPLLSSPLARSLRRRSLRRAGHPARDVRQRARRAGAPVADLGPADFVVREDKVAREVLQRRAGRRADADRDAGRQQPGRAQLHLATSATALAGFINDDDRRRRRQERGRDHRHRPSGRRSSPTTRSTRRELIRRASTASSTQRRSGSYLLDGIIEVSQGFKKREAAAAGDRRDHHRRPGAERSRSYEDGARSRCATSAPRSTSSSLGPPVEQHQRGRAQPHRRARRGPARRPAAAATSLLTSTALAAKLKQLADELTHQYQVTYARPQTLIPPERVTVTAAKRRRDGARHARSRKSKDGQ